MAPQKYSGQVMNNSANCKTNGVMYPSSAAVMNAAKKPKMEQIQADHELFLQAFESEYFSTNCQYILNCTFTVVPPSSLPINSLHINHTRAKSHIHNNVCSFFLADQ